MPSRVHDKISQSRRNFLKQMTWAPVLFLPAPVGFRSLLPGLIRTAHFPFSDVRLTPHYPAQSPLDDILRLADPGSDEYVLEGYVANIEGALKTWSERLRTDPHATSSIANILDDSIRATRLAAIHEFDLRPHDRFKVTRREFGPELIGGAEHLLDGFKSYFSPFSEIDTADSQIYSCRQITESPLTLETSIRYEFVGTRHDHAREQRIGTWQMRWIRSGSQWKVTQWVATDETASSAANPLFADITAAALAHNDSYKNQLLRGSDYWRTVLDGATGIDVYGNHGLAVGDFDNDGFDDLYICQPAGLPNRLYRNRGDGTLDDVTEQAAVGVLDFTASALFADFQNRGLQDLVVVCATGPLLFLNDGHGHFSLNRDAFHFAHPPQGAFTHVAAADYDRDGRLDLYFCLYNYYQGLDQYRYPVPYFDARNGPPNFLFHNKGNGTFEDRTEAAGLSAENDRYSFACCWGDANGNGWPDLYVVNDFGRNSLYRNNGNGTFTAASEESRVNEAGAGMSACWLDFDNDGKQDIYAAGMWVPAGMRVFEDPHFHPGDPENIRQLYRRHMSGNSLYRNNGAGKFENVAIAAGVEKGRWSWSSDAWDFDHDGFPDLYVANGYISGAEARDVSSFFWRQVVAKSPSDATPSSPYERGWGAINELIRSDSTWNGHERNVFFANNRDGTFSDISGISGIDFRDDSRAFALSDLDGDGRLELVLKNRNAPQLRIVRNTMPELGNVIAIRLRGTKSNRDAIGAYVMVEAGQLRQTKYLQAGSGFLSQHTKELSFGLGKHDGTVRATIAWPSGFTQTFDALPANHRIQITEGSAEFHARRFADAAWHQSNPSRVEEGLPSEFGNWLIEPVPAPDFSLPDTAGNLRDLHSLRGNLVLLTFWTTGDGRCREQLQQLQKAQSRLATLRILALNLDNPSDAGRIKSLAARDGLSFPVLLGDAEIAGIYNIVYRYMFARHRDLPLPTSFLLDQTGSIVKVYQGTCASDQIAADLQSIPQTPDERLRKALPFSGKLVQDAFQRNSFTYGIAFFQNGYLDHAAQAFKHVIATKPDDPEAYYNLGTVYLRRNSLFEAQQSLDQAVKLRSDYPEALNNLGMIAAQQRHDDEAIAYFQKSLALRPSYSTALLNLANVYRRAGSLDEAQQVLDRALAADPGNPEIHYNLGMIYARRDETEDAVTSLRKAIELRPNYADALNNLGVLFVQKQRYSEAEQQFEKCIREAPDFDQAYLNLARVDVILNEKEKARSVLQALLEKQPQHKMAQQMLQMLY